MLFKYMSLRNNECRYRPESFGIEISDELKLDRLPMNLENHPQPKSKDSITHINSQQHGLNAQRKIELDIKW
jgi:hypothetical protein